MAYRRRRVQRKRRPRTRRGRRLNGVTAVGFRSAYPSFGPQSFGVRRRGRLAGANARKRRMGFGARTARKRSRVADTGGYDQWRRYKYARKFGKMTVKKQLKSVVSYYEWVWRRLGALRTGGSIFFPHWRENGIGDTDFVHTPILLVDLTSAKTPFGNACPVRNVVLDRDKVNGGLNAIRFDAVPGFDETGAAFQNEWQAFATNARNAATEANFQLSGSAILGHSEIRLDLWGAKTRPCEFTITLCQIDEQMLPDPYVYPSTVAQQYHADPKALSFWGNLHDQLTWNPNVRRPNSGVGNNVRVLDRRVFMVDPTESTENDPDGHCKTVRLFYRHNRLCNFEWEASNTNYVSDNPLTYDVKGHAKQDCSVKPKARIYLMITCASYDTIVGAYEDMNYSNRGSLNMQVLNRWYDL